MTAITQRRMSIEKMAGLWRYANGDGSGEGITMADFLDLSFNAETFAEFLEINRATVQLYEEAAV